MIINRLACADAGPQRRARLAVGLAAGGALLAGVWMGPAFAAPASPPAAPQPIFEIEVKGVIGVASAGYIARGLERARDENAALVVLKLDTPGGLVTSTREIVQAILQSPVPVAVYVAPIGARAASAGTYIAYAAHIAAMAPGTHLGAATPVAIGGPPGLPGGGEPGKDRRDEKGRDEKGGGETEPVGAMERKIINDAAAYIRSLAQLRGRNAEWAEQAVRRGATLTADEAVRERVVDFVARDLGDLLVRAEGRTVSIGGVERTVSVKGAAVVAIEPDWRTRLLGAVSDPNIAYILLMIGIYGIILEFWNPGVVVPGVVGGISLLLALMALSVLPVDYASLGLMLLGIALMIAEAFTPGVGVLGIGGLVAFVAGSLFLFDPDAVRGVDFRVAWPLVAASAVTSAIMFLFVIGIALKVHRRAVVTGSEEMLGLEGRIIDWDGLTGHVRAHGEVWQARAERPLEPGSAVRTVAREGLVLIVEPATTRR